MACGGCAKRRAERAAAREAKIAEKQAMIEAAQKAQQTSLQASGK